MLDFEYGIMIMLIFWNSQNANTVTSLCKQRKLHS